MKINKPNDGKYKTYSYLCHRIIDEIAFEKTATLSDMRHYKQFFNTPRREIMAIIVFCVTIFIIILSNTLTTKNLVLEVAVFSSIILLVALIGIYLFFYFNSYRWSALGVFVTGFFIITIALLACSLFADLYYNYLTFSDFLKNYFVLAYGLGILVSVMIYFWLKLKYEDLESRSKEEEIQRFCEETEAEKLQRNKDSFLQNAEKDANMNDAHQKILYDLQHLFETEKTYCQQELTIDNVAKTLQTNSKYLSNAINQNYQKSFTEYVNTWRIEEAMAMFKEQEENGKYTHLTVQTVAEEVGFKSRTSFYMAFKRMVGVTPVEYQKAIREEG